jgi:hypothetical protein
MSNSSDTWAGNHHVQHFDVALLAELQATVITAVVPAVDRAFFPASPRVLPSLVRELFLIPSTGRILDLSAVNIEVSGLSRRRQRLTFHRTELLADRTQSCRGRLS